MPKDLTSEVWNDAVEWDRPTWRRAFKHWEQHLDSHLGPTADAVEIGGKRGGGSLFLSYRYGISVACSDLGGPDPDARVIHARHGVDGLIHYTDLDATKLALPDACMDVVMFKSVLGSIGRALGPDGLQAAVSEMARVLRPGGVLLFAENLVATRVHQFFRVRLRHWAGDWHYLDLGELECLLKKEFSEVEIASTGIFALFAPNRPHIAKTVLAWIDARIERHTKPSSRYLAHGVAFR